MNNGWPTTTIGETCAITSGGTPSKGNTDFWSGDIPWVSAKDLKFDRIHKAELHITSEAVEKSATKLAPIGSLLILVRGMGLANGVAIGEVTSPVAFNQDIRAIHPPPTVVPRFLLLALRSNLMHQGGQRVLSAAAHGTLKIDSDALRRIAFPVPSLAEQQRIVAILDEAFDGIATAKANAEKNLHNARALFESHLQSVFTQRVEGWVESKLGDEVDIMPGFAFKSAKYSHNPDDVRLLRGDNIVQGGLRWDDVKKWPTGESGLYKRYQLREGDVVLAMDRPWVKAGLKHAIMQANDIPSLLVQRTARLRCKHNLDSRFLMKLIGSTGFTRHILGVQTGIGVPHISGQQIADFTFLMPPKLEQERIADKLESLLAETLRLESLYQRKLAAFDELKSSLLYQAFSGQLNSSCQLCVASESVTFPTSILNISTTELHAGVLAMAYQLHETAGKPQEFTHVKAEKIAHMLEAHVGIDLGRQPVKCAAGPNDFPHLKKVEHRARKVLCFDFKKEANGKYRLTPLGGFDRLIERTRTALGDRVGEVEQLLKWMLKLDVRQAEIVATVFAGWNNLLLDGKQPTDEEIVLESRENWHADKLKIDRAKFAAAVAWLKKQGVVPLGRGKRVV